MFTFIIVGFKIKLNHHHPLAKVAGLCRTDVMRLYYRKPETEVKIV